MSKPKPAPNKARSRRKPNRKKVTSDKKVASEKARTTHRKEAPKVAAEKARDTNRNRKAAAQFQEPTRVLDPKPSVAERNVVRDFGVAQAKVSPPPLAERNVVRDFRLAQREVSPPRRAEMIVVRDFGAPDVKVSLHALAGRIVEDVGAQVPGSLHALGERKLEQTRMRVEQSINALETAFERSVLSLDAAGQGAVAVNRKIRDFAGRNISTGFDLALRLAKARNVAESLEVQEDYWRKQFGELSMQAEELFALLQKITSSVVEPIRRK